MKPVKGSWWPVLDAAELGRKPVGRVRFGEPLVFWRAASGVVCMPDRCPHRGAALSLGEVSPSGDALACPFHGLEFGSDGRCTLIPVEQDFAIPEDFGLPAYPVTEADGYIWLWRGPLPQGELPVPAQHPDTQPMQYGASGGLWHAHYTRCIENVCDFSHLPFVHKTTIGRFKKGWQTTIEMEDVAGGFRAHLLQDGRSHQSLEFLYPNRWLLRLNRRFMFGLVFVPVDDEHTWVYGRSWYDLPVPGLKWLMNGYTRLSQYLVFREDWPIVASQVPGDVLTATDEKLLPSDAPVLAYRKLHRSYY